MNVNNFSNILLKAELIPTKKLQRNAITFNKRVEKVTARMSASYEEGTSHSSFSSDETDGKKQKEEGYSDSSDSDDCMEPIIVTNNSDYRKSKKIKRDDSDSDSSSVVSAPNSSESISGKVTVPVSPASSVCSHARSSETRISSDGEESDGSESPTPEGEWEVEEIRDYVKDDFGESYLVKWKDWEEVFNTWEPITNLLNCDAELYRFYRTRKRLYQEILDSSEYIILPNGKRRRKGPSLPCVPPDPRKLEDRMEEFFTIINFTPDETEIVKIFGDWKKKKISLKSRWPMVKVNTFLEDAIDGKLGKREMNELRKELILIEVDKKNQQLQDEIKKWEKKINEITKGRPYITVENDVDMSGPPINFQFINEYVAGEGVEIPTNPPMGCSCGEENGKNCYEGRDRCCAMQFGYKFAYTRFKKLNVLQGSPIYECNSKCTCGPDCPNRVVQDGKSDQKLSIFRTSNDCGWGVKTLKSIKKGTFVTLYVGEVIKSEEADRRGKIYDKNGSTYLFDLDFNDPDTYPYSVDASEYGNVAHFINHSCMPNLGVYAVWTDCLDPNLPKLAMFALRDISRNEELTFDYNRQLTSESRSKAKLDDQQETDDDDDDDDDEIMKNKGKKTICKCGTPKCRKYIFS